MANLKSLRIKEKNYIFQVFGNEKSASPARAVFSRFPMPDELFPLASQKNILESPAVRDFDNNRQAKTELVKNIVDIMIENIAANRFDTAGFIRECIDHFEDFHYDSRKIKTAGDFLALPQEAVQKITRDLYLYSRTEDEFTMGE
jgi:hypothetical protein